MKFVTSSTPISREDIFDDTKHNFDEGKPRYLPSYLETVRKSKSSQSKKNYL
ncbi:MAG: hypothetical protein IJ285_06045 [Clostridia bacterium]|nr:hypothetical protein [Clostridia bacterium]